MTRQWSSLDERMMGRVRNLTLGLGHQSLVPVGLGNDVERRSVIDFVFEGLYPGSVREVRYRVEKDLGRGMWCSLVKSLLQMHVSFVSTGL